MVSTPNWFQNMVGIFKNILYFNSLLIFCYATRNKSHKKLGITISNTFFFLSLSTGEQYARMMLIFCMTMMFCVSCPLITPFGCMYFITKHYVDRHNIFYVYKPSKINKRVHATAISFVILSTVVLQFFMTIFRLVFTALWLPIYYLCVHHVILAGCWTLKLALNVEEASYVMKSRNLF